MLTQSVMFNTYFELEAKMGDEVDYKDTANDSRLFAICKCKGRVPSGEPECTRNPEKELAYSGQGYCLWYLANGSAHCGHRFTHKKE